MPRPSDIVRLFSAAPAAVSSSAAAAAAHVRSLLRTVVPVPAVQDVDAPAAQFRAHTESLAPAHDPEAFSAARALALAMGTNVDEAVLGRLMDAVATDRLDAVLDFLASCPRDRQPLPGTDPFFRTLAPAYAADLPDAPDAASVDRLPAHVRSYLSRRQAWEVLRDMDNGDTFVELRPVAEGSAELVECPRAVNLALRLERLAKLVQSGQGLAAAWARKAAVPAVPDAPSREAA